MPTITITINLDVPDGTEVKIQTTNDTKELSAGLPADVADRVERLVPTRYRPYVTSYLERATAELGCIPEVPDSERRDEYVNVFPPARCRRARVSGLSYSSSRTALYTGPIDLDGFTLAEQTFNSGTYAYPKLAHLDSDAAVDEALELTKIAIARFER
jgi:hypothetical protein